MSSEVDQSAVDVASAEAPATETPAPRMALQVNIENRGNCLRHIAVTVPEIDIQEIREEVLDELRDKAQVPGFRPVVFQTPCCSAGSAPRSQRTSSRKY